MKTICGIDCEECLFKSECAGCVKTQGKPFGEACPVAACCLSKGQQFCEECAHSACDLREKLILEFNALGIADMPEVSNLNVLKGSYVNLEYTVPSGQKVKLLKDNKLYFGNQIHKDNSDRCYGIVADEAFLLVCEYGCEGANPEIIVYKKR